MDGWMDGESSLDSGHASRRAAEAGQFGSVEREVLLSSSLAASGQASGSSGQHLDAGEMNCGPRFARCSCSAVGIQVCSLQHKHEMWCCCAGWKFEKKNSRSTIFKQTKLKNKVLGKNQIDMYVWHIFVSVKIEWKIQFEEEMAAVLNCWHSL